MRYHSKFPAVLSVDLSVQRARPTCKLSLANVAAWSTTMEATVTEDLNAMQVDPPAFTAITPLFGEKTNAVPFPTAASPPRQHSLLKPSLTVSVGPTSLKTSSTREPPSPTEQTPPRKRTRTSALSTTPKPRSYRLSSLPMRSSPSPSTSNAPIARPPSSGTSSKENEPFTYLFPTLSPTTSKASVGFTSSLSFTPRALPLPPTASNATPPRRRRQHVRDVIFLMSLYEALAYGLAMRYPEGSTKFSVCQSTDGWFNPIAGVTGPVMSQLDMQETLLAEHLKSSLAANGNPARTKLGFVQTQCVSVDTSGLPDVTPPSSLPESRPLQDIIRATSVASYPHLVSTLFMKHRYRPRRTAGFPRKSSDAPRKRSRLAECISI